MKRRNTGAKNEILDLLINSDSALSHEMIQESIATKMDRATIYRVLNSFCEDKTVHKIIGDDGKQYFKFCTKCSEKKHRHNHFHFRCERCGKLECLETEISVPLPRGYVFHSSNAVIAGVCSSCK